MTQGLAYSLFLHDQSAIVYRQGERTSSQMFAEKFACYFLIPSEALQERLLSLKVRVVTRPIEVVHLSRYFGVSYETMLYRLEQENKIVGYKDNFQNVQAAVLARQLGYSPAHYELQQGFHSIEERFPRIFIELAYRAVEEDKISLRTVAEMLGISDIELEDRLNFEDTGDDEFEEDELLQSTDYSLIKS